MVQNWQKVKAINPFLAIFVTFFKGNKIHNFTMKKHKYKNIIFLDGFSPGRPKNKGNYTSTNDFITPY